MWPGRRVNNDYDVVKDADSGDIISPPDGPSSVDVKNIPAGQRLIVDKVRALVEPADLDETQPSLAPIRVKEHARLCRAGRYRLHLRGTPRAGGRW